MSRKVCRMADTNKLKPRRERSANFTPREQWVFLDLMEKFGGVIQDRHNDLATNSNKEAAWTHLTNTFNLKPGVTKRSEKSLKNLWRRVKLEAKRERKKVGSLPSNSSGLETVKAKAAAAAIAAGWRDDSENQEDLDCQDNHTDHVLTPSSLVEVVTDTIQGAGLGVGLGVGGNFHNSFAAAFNHNHLLYDLVKYRYYQNCNQGKIFC